MFKCVIFGSNSDYDRIIYKEQNKSIEYIEHLEEMEKPIHKFFARIYFSKKIHKKLKTPLKNTLNRIFLKKIGKYSPNCFVFFPNRNYFHEMGFFNKLKKNYPDSKLVMYCRDLIETYPDFDINYYKNNFDLVLTYDAMESEKYNIIKVPPVYSKFTLEEVSNEKKSDLVFVGYSKNRLDILIDIYNVMTKRGLECDFTILGVPEELRKYRDKINYTKKLTYTEVIEKIKRSKSVLEIVQTNSSGYTLRVMEAIFYDKKLLTNNPTVKHSNFFDDNLIQVIDSVNDINSDFFNDTEYKFSNEIKQQYTLNNWINFIREKLETE